MVVVDASLLVDALIGEVAAFDRMRGEELHAPHIIDLEVTSVLRRFAAAGKTDAAGGLALLRALANADIRRHSHVPLLAHIWALRDNLPAYDAAYVALARALDAPLVTTDRRLAATPGLPCKVELIESS